MMAAFATTRWTLVLQAASSDSKIRQEALAELLSTNWFPLYTYLRRSGHSPHAAEDLIQGFFVRLLEKNLLEGIQDGRRGRFRSFLLVCLKNYVNNEWKKDSAIKRGGATRTISLDFQSADKKYQIEPLHQLTPEHAFERAWAVELIDRAMRRVAESWKSTGKGKQFAELKAFLLPEDQTPSYEEVAKRLSAKKDSLKVAVHRLRKEFRRTLCSEVAETLERGDLLEDEINRLFASLQLDR